MAAVAPPGAVATALRHVRYQKQARSASDTRPHRADPVTDAHRSRSLTCILTTDNDAGAGTLKWRLLYTYDELPPRVTGDLRGIHNRTRLRRRIDAGGPLAGPPSRPGAPLGLPCCSAEPLQSSFCGIMGGLSTLRLNGLRASTAVFGLRLFIIYPHLCKKPGKKTPRGSLFAVPR